MIDLTSENTRAPLINVVINQGHTGLSYLLLWAWVRF